MTTRPLALPGWAVRALEERRLTQWRWPLRPQPEPWRDYHLEGGCQTRDWKFETGTRTEDGIKHVFGLWMHCGFHESRFQPLPIAPGDVRWVRETWCEAPLSDHGQCCAYKSTATYLCGDKVRPADPIKWRSPVTMPRRFSRWTLTVESVRVCRLQEFTGDDALREGVGLDPETGAYRGVESSGVGGATPLFVWPEMAHIERLVDRFGIDAWDRNDWCAVAVWKAERRNVDA